MAYVNIIESTSFQSRKRLYNRKCPSVRPSVCDKNASASQNQVYLSLCLSLDLSDNHLKDPWIFLISLISNVLDLSYLRSIRCLIRYQYPSASLSLCLTTIMPISFLIFLSSLTKDISSNKRGLIREISTSLKLLC